MTKLRYSLGGAVFALALAFVWVSFGFAAGQVDQTTVAGRSDEEPPLPLIAADAAVDDALASEGITPVYFAPQDNDGTATVVFLYNTSAMTQTVAVRGYNTNGGLQVSETVTVTANGLVPLISDILVAAPPPGWANAVLTNFTDSTTYAGLALPQGIKIDGYVVFNPGSGEIDPRADQGALPLRFSADPLAIFLPAVNSSP